MLITYKDILSYQYCPFYKGQSVPYEPETYPLTTYETHFVNTLLSIFSKSSNSGIKQAPLKVSPAIMHNETIAKSALFNIYYSLKRLTNKYAEDFYDNGYVIMSSNVEMSLKVSYSYYQDTFQVLLYKNGLIAPIYIDKFTAYARNNRFGFNAYMLQELFAGSAHSSEYFVIDPTDANKKDVKIHKFTLNQDKIEEYGFRLRQIIKQIDNKIQVPNASNCSKCPIIKECNPW